jgi:hypothetical protein
VSNPTERRNMIYRIVNPPFGMSTDRFKGFQPTKNVFQNNPVNMNFDPRIGIAWDPAGDHKNSVRAGFGISTIRFSRAPGPQYLGGSGIRERRLGVDEGYAVARDGQRPVPRGVFPSSQSREFRFAESQRVHGNRRREPHGGPHHGDAGPGAPTSVGVEVYVLTL